MVDKSETVRRLIRLAKQKDNPNEAAAAWAQAQRLATLHHLDLDELSREPDDPPHAKTVGALNEVTLDTLGKRVVWREMIAGAVANANHCRLYCLRRRGQVKIQAYGEPDNLSRCLDLYRWISSQCDALGREATADYRREPDLDPRFDDSPREFGRNFRMGFANKIQQRMPKPSEVIEETRKIAKTGSALARVNNALDYVAATEAALDRYSDTLGADKARRLKTGLSGRGAGFAEGMRAGAAASLDTHRKLSP